MYALRVSVAEQRPTTLHNLSHFFREKYPYLIMYLCTFLPVPMCSVHCKLNVKYYMKVYYTGRDSKEEYRGVGREIIKNWDLLGRGGMSRGEF